MTYLRNKTTGEVKELPGKDWRVVMGWWSHDDPKQLSYPASEWEKVEAPTA
jgi:hypothetical protein